jgi:protocatechuate 3,4-dioxygenase beta subunit
MSRIWKIVLAVLAVAVLASGLYAWSMSRRLQTVVPNVSPSLSPQASVSPAAGDVSSCGLTPSTTAGPYYISGTPLLSGGNLNYTNLPGNPMKISGYVYGGVDNTKPLTNAMIEIWQADNSGQYHPAAQGAASQYSGQLALRGYVMTDAKGYYEFMSIFPAEYEGRVRHIHARASASGYQPVVTQMIAYLPGDKVTPQQDNIASELPACNMLKFTDTGGVRTSAFDYHLAAQ